MPDSTTTSTICYICGCGGCHPTSHKPHVAYMKCPRCGYHAYDGRECLDCGYPQGTYFER